MKIEGYFLLNKCVKEFIFCYTSINFLFYIVLPYF